MDGRVAIRSTRPCQNRCFKRLQIDRRFGRGQRRHAIAELRIADDRHAAAIGVERLERLKTEDRGVAERADGAAAVARAERVRAVLDHAEVVPPRDRDDLVHVTRQPPQVRGHDRDRSRGDARVRAHRP